MRFRAGRGLSERSIGAVGPLRDVGLLVIQEMKLETRRLRLEVQLKLVAYLINQCKWLT